MNTYYQGKNGLIYRLTAKGIEPLSHREAQLFLSELDGDFDQRLFDAAYKQVDRLTSWYNPPRSYGSAD